MFLLKDDTNTARLNILSENVFIIFIFLPIVERPPPKPVAASISAASLNSLAAASGKSFWNICFTTCAS